MIQNPTLRYEVITDDNALSYVEQMFGEKSLNRPDIVKVYQELDAPIIKADLLRYMIMYSEGGIYADIDVSALNPFTDFIPSNIKERDIDMIIGVETDQPDFKNHPILGVKAQSFVQWTFVTKPRLPVMLELINNILEWLTILKEQQKKKNLRDLEFDFDAVINGTGPTAFTNAILAHMSAVTGRVIDWNEFHKLRESKVVGNVLVLPAQAFAASTGHSDSGTHNAMGALVKHWFGASHWTKQHQRFKHPVYGEIEKCNWDPECVRLWDMNTAHFDSLSREEQLAVVMSQKQGVDGSSQPSAAQETIAEPQSEDKSSPEPEAQAEPGNSETQEPNKEVQSEDDTSTDDKAQHPDSESSDDEKIELRGPNVAAIEAMLLEES